MPFPLLPVIAAGMSLASGGLNAYSTGRTNKRSRMFAREMYNTQREDALEDFKLQNEYNSPRMQMQRLQEAGLNPNLVYGGGSGVTEAGGIRSSDATSMRFEAPRYGDALKDSANSFLAFHDLEIKKAQADNLAEQNKVLQTEAALKDAQRLSTIVGITGQKVKIDKDKLDLALDQQLFDTNIEFRRRSVENLRAQTVEIGSRVDIAQAMKQPNIDLAVQYLLNARLDAMLKHKTGRSIDAETRNKVETLQEIKQKVHNMYIDGKLKEFDLWLKNNRGKAADWPSYLRMFNDIVNDAADLISN